ncbi:MAG TPA: hypothetical protein VNU70_13745 [Puia sp.]|jgi:hypothetical protein|nr:hypothetical protein [Puia sp.]
MRCCLLAILLLLFGYGWVAKGQDLTGQWTGTAADRTSERKQKLVLSITEGDSAFGGVLRWYSPETQTIRHIVVSGRFFHKDSILTVREDSTKQRIMGGGPGSDASPGAGSNAANGASKGPPGGFYVLFYRRTAGRRDMLEGHWKSNDQGTAKTGDWTIRLEKKAPPFIPLPPARTALKKNDSSDIRQYQAFQGRQSVVAASIPATGADTIRVALYDNGEIDGDSVSLYINNELLARHVRLTADAQVILVPIDKAIPVNKLVLFAENLGRLPPNTALMEVTVRGKTYNLFLSTDYKRNASVEFLLQE